MKKEAIATILSVASFLLGSPLFSQDFEKEFFIINAGVSVPVGQFASTTYKGTYQNQPDAGYAKLGTAGNLAYHVKIKKNLYLSFKTGFTTNNFKSNAYQYNLSNYAGNGSPFIYSYSVSATKWRNLNVSVGISNMYKLNKKNSLQLINSFYTGVCAVRTPDVAIKIKDANGLPVYPSTTQHSTASSFIWSIDLGLRYKVNPEINIIFLTSYQSTRPKFKNNPIAGNVYRFTQGMSVLNFSLATTIALD